MGCGRRRLRTHRTVRFLSERSRHDLSIGAIRTHTQAADKIRDFLTDHARITYVSLPEELPVVETLAAIAEEVPGELNPVIFNRLLSPLSVPVPSGESALARAAQLHNAIVRQQAHWIAQLPSSLYLPLLLGANGPMEVSDLLTGVLEAAT